MFVEESLERFNLVFKLGDAGLEGDGFDGEFVTFVDELDDTVVSTSEFFVDCFDELCLTSGHCWWWLEVGKGPMK